MSNAGSCNAIIATTLWLVSYTAFAVSGALLELTDLQSVFIALVCVLAATWPLVASMQRRLRVTRSPVRFKGAGALDAGYVDRRPPGMQNLDREALRKWAQANSTFTRNAYVNIAVMVGSALGLASGVFIAFKSLVAGAVIALIAAVCWSAAIYRNHRLAERHIRCPYCDTYPFGHYPLRVIAELESDGLCPGCGTQLPLDP